MNGMNGQVKLILSSGQTPERALTGVIDRYQRQANDRLRRRKLDPNQRYCLQASTRQALKDDLSKVVDRLLLTRQREP